MTQLVVCLHCWSPKPEIWKCVICKESFDKNKYLYYCHKEFYKTWLCSSISSSENIIVPEPKRKWKRKIGICKARYEARWEISWFGWYKFFLKISDWLEKEWEFARYRFSFYFRLPIDR